MSSLQLALLMLAALLVTIAAFGWPASGRPHLGWLGVAIAILALILPALH